MIEPLDIYLSELSNYLRLNVVIFCFFCVLAIALLVFNFVLFKKVLKGKKNEKKRKQKKQSKGDKDLIKLVASSMLTAFLVLIAIPTQIKDISELRYDVNNQAFVVYEGDFEIHHKTEWRRKALPNGKYFVVVFDNGAEHIETQISKRMVEEYKLSEGRHSDITIVYAEKSQIIVDMWDRGD